MLMLVISSFEQSNICIDQVSISSYLIYTLESLTTPVLEPHNLIAAASSSLHSWPYELLRSRQMPPPSRRTRVTRSRSRERGDARPSSRPLTTYSSVGQQQLMSLPPLCPGSLCFDCCRIVPLRELQNVVTRCCEYQCARTDSIDLCAHCFSINWDRFVAESGTFVGLSDEQISQGFSIWMFHKNHCK